MPKLFMEKPDFLSAGSMVFDIGARVSTSNTDAASRCWFLPRVLLPPYYFCISVCESRDVIKANHGIGCALALSFGLEFIPKFLEDTFGNQFRFCARIRIVLSMMRDQPIIMYS